MNERLNIRRMQTPETSAESGPFDPRRDISKAERQEMIDRFRSSESVSTLRDLKILFQDEAPTFTDARWASLIEAFRNIESQSMGSEWMSHLRSVAAAKIAFPQGVFMLSERAEEALNSEVERNRKSDWHSLAFRAVAKHILFPDKPVLTPEESRKLFKDAQNALSYFLEASEKRNRIERNRMGWAIRRAADVRILVPSSKFIITPEEWTRLREILVQVRAEDTSLNLEEFSGFAASLAIVAADTIRLTDDGLKLTYADTRYTDMPRAAPESLEI